MSQSVVLLVGGTKILERALQQSVEAPLVTVATIEEATQVLTSKPVGLLVLGPTLRRALAVVAMLRREGQTEPKLIVVYRDDQREEVKRHMKSKAVADRYVVQSRIGKELEPAAEELWKLSQMPQSSDGEYEEILSGSLETMPEAATQLLEVLDLPDNDQPPLTSEVLGAFDAEAFEQDIAIEDLPELEEELEPLEEIDELEEDALVEETAEEELSGDTLEVIDMLEIEEEEEETVVQAPAAVAAPAAQQPAAEVIEELEAAELVEELAVVEVLEEVTEGVTEVATEDVTEEVTEELVEELVIADLVEEAPVAVVEAAKTVESADVVEELEAVDLIEEEAVVAVAASASHLEEENEQLRAELKKALAAAEALAAAIQDLKVRLDGAESARNAAVEARMVADQTAQVREEEQTKLRAELATARGRETASEALLETRKRVAADAAKALLAVASSLEER
ncbi:MAG: hypothetical protein ACOYOB_12630 [Myxococcota bacterium]